MNIKYLLSCCLLILFSFTAQAQIPSEEPVLPLPGIIELRFADAPNDLIYCDQSAVDFPTVLPGQTNSLDFVIRNVGSEMLILNDLEIMGSTAFSVTPDIETETHLVGLRPGEAFTFTIHFSPSVTGEYEAKLRIHSSDPFSDPCSVRLQGDCYLPPSGTLRLRDEGSNYLQDCSVLVATTFPDVLVGNSATKTVHLENIGEQTLYFTGMELSNSDAFSISYNFPFSGAAYPIPAGESASFDIIFDPTEPGLEIGTLTINTSDPDGVCSYNVEGEGYIIEPGTLRIELVNGGWINCNNYVSMDFEDLLLGESFTKDLLIKNIGDEPLVFYGIEMTGSTDFTIVLDFPFDGISHTLLPNESVPFHITFTPDGPGEKYANFTVLTSDEINSPCLTRLEGGGLDPDAPHLRVIKPMDGATLHCGDTYYVDLSETYPGPLLYGFYLPVRNYGLEDLLISGEVSILGVPGSGDDIDLFDVETLEWKFMNVLVQLPGNQVTTVVFDLVTNDPYQPSCTIYVEINQIVDEEDGEEEGQDEVPGGKKGTIAKVEVSSKANKTGKAFGTPVLSKTEHGTAFRLYPTVTASQLILESNAEDYRKYQIVDTMGKILAAGSANAWDKEVIPVEGLPAGMYYLRIEGEKKVLRFVKK